MTAFIDFINGYLEIILMVLLLGTGLLLTLRLGFIQFRRLGHGLAVVSGKYDDPDAPGEVTHFQALTTALSATVGIGNIAGVAIAIHWGGPGAVFWMWITALLGMATKFSEVTLAQHYRTKDRLGQTAGGPMYYIEKGLGTKWRPVALFFAGALMIMAFISGNAIQANTLADLTQTMFGLSPWLTGTLSAALVGLVIIGGINRIGKVTSILAPSMAALYVCGGLAVLLLNADQVWPSVRLIFSEAFQPTAGVAGTGAGVLLQTLIWGVRRGLFSNEAGQGSAPIAHSAAKTDEPVSEGVVALLEPLIDTLVICTITALVILSTGVWKETTTTPIDPNGDISFVNVDASNFAPLSPPDTVWVVDGVPSGEVRLAWHEVAIENYYQTERLEVPFTGYLIPGTAEWKSADHQVMAIPHGAAVENAAPLTMWAYRSALGTTGGYIVLLCVLLFSLSTAISWSYYGDRCAVYIFGEAAIRPYRFVYVGFHFLGAILSLNLIWELGDLAMALGTIPNVIALVALSGVIVRLTNEYFKKMGG